MDHYNTKIADVFTECGNGMTCYEHNTPVNYDDAESFCLGIGARLVEFWDETESDLVRRMKFHWYPTNHLKSSHLSRRRSTFLVDLLDKGPKVNIKDHIVAL